MNHFYLRIVAVLVLTFVGLNSYSQKDTLGLKPDTSYAIPQTVDANLAVMKAPEGFVVSELYNGYIHYQAAASILLTFISDVNYIKISEGMTQEYFDSNKLVFVSKRELLSESGTRGICYKFTFMLDGIEFTRQMAFSGDLNNTLWVNATYPSKYNDLLDSDFDNALNTIDIKLVK